ncbi:Permease of the drug/metabolite transporter (DMT) superfamily [Mariniphaga anaerophila]|uniref:Permease of the drug/metabolite transporter (DMT) superfamily n=1 Tax=Mariniphaga anaerophila TaxID=1484053 RepID=A0A1M5AIQ6_9BACT|nr:DMT family transporter [Mariniphaga anaerophila]SHF30014.1 Permease of the drug/metabolite transporter (DMT) superfamily [Mariniphaga anaerophila]
MKNKELLAYFTALGAAFFWGFSFVWFKIAFLAYKPVTIVLFRLIISAGLIWLIAWLLKRLQKPTKKDLRLFVLMAFFEPFLYFLGESYGLTYISSTEASVIVGTIPLLSPIAAWYFFREKVTWKNAVGFLFSFLGVALVVLDESFGFNASPLGIGLEFVAVFAAISYSIVLRHVVMRYNSLTIIAYQNLIGVVLFLPVWLVVDLKDFVLTPFHPQAFRAIILLAVFASTLAFVFFTQSIRKIGVNRSNTFVNLIPVFVAVLSFFVLKEELGFQKILGILVVIAGLFLAQARKRKSSRQKVVEVHTIS